MQAKHKKKLIMAFCGLIVIAIAVGIYTYTNFFKIDLSFLGLNQPEETSHVNYQMGQATKPCTEAIEDNVRGKTLSKTFDNISSRYDATRNEYMLFYSLVNESRFGSKRSFHILCRISASTNRLKDFEIVTSTGS